MAKKQTENKKEPGSRKDAAKKEWKIVYRKNGSEENSIFDDESSARRFMNKLIDEGSTHIRMIEPPKFTKDGGKD